jgi:hypothetical protein
MDTSTTNFALNKAQETRLKNSNNSFIMSSFLFYKLPAAWFMGVRMKSLTIQKALVTLPYGWKSQNPYKSIYFAAQCAAGEFATGTLAMLALEGGPKISMLVTHIEADFFKKANSLTTFTCEQGEDVFRVVAKAIETKEAQVLEMKATGIQATGERVSEVRVTWTFKVK